MQRNRKFESVVLEELNYTELVSKHSVNENIMRQRGNIFHDDTRMLHQYDEMPLTMKEIGVEKGFDFDFKYGQKSACEFNEDLAAIHQSMMQSPKINRHRKKKRRKYPKFRFVPSLEAIKENELFETHFESIRKLEKDLASIHEERALNRGMSITEEGRRERRKRGSRSSSARTWLDKLATTMLVKEKNADTAQ